MLPSNVVHRWTQRASPNGHLRIWRWVVALALVASGCITPLPLQTASAVPQGITRLGGGVSVTPYCSFTGDPLNECARGLTGIPLPELRLDVRRGLGNGWDLGGSGRVELVAYRGFQAGLLVDAKKEVWAGEIGPGRRQVLSLGGAVSADAVVVSSGGTPSVRPELGLALPLFYGWQGENSEWVVSPRLVQRFPYSRGLYGVSEFGLALGVFHRSSGLGLQLSYQAPFELPTSGLFTVSIGGFLDLGGAPAP